MKDYTFNNLDYRTVEKLIFDNDYCLDVTTVQGALVDSYFIDDWNLGIRMKKGRNIKPRKHLYAVETYYSEWSSVLTLVLTDSDKKYYTAKRDYLSQYLKENKKDQFLDRDDKNYLNIELSDCVQELKN